MNTNTGFTLVELLIAMAVAALISLGTLFLTNTSISTKRLATESATAFTGISRALRVIEQDFSQLILDRAIRDPFGQYQGGLHQDYEGLSLTRLGWALSHHQKDLNRSNLQRVRYTLAEQGTEHCPDSDEYSVSEARCLLRQFRTHLDDDGNGQWRTQRLLFPVQEISWEFLTVNSQTEEKAFFDSLPDFDVNTGKFSASVFSVRYSINLTTGQTIQKALRVPEDGR